MTIRKALSDGVRMGAISFRKEGYRFLGIYVDRERWGSLFCVAHDYTIVHSGMQISYSVDEEVMASYVDGRLKVTTPSTYIKFD